MKAGLLLVGILVISGLLVCNSFTSGQNPGDANKDSSNAPTIELQKIADGLHSPVAAAFTNDGTGRLLVCDQIGLIRVIEKGKLIPEPFLDIRSKMVKLSGGYDERGLLGIALHPQFAKNHKLYIYFSAPSSHPGSSHKNILAEFKVSAKPNQADLKSERVILAIEHPESNHNGGDLHFGPDGYLYIAQGDGGGGGDQHGEIGNAQNLNTLLGKILRIDVDKGITYSIPADNPFTGKKARPEIWAYGLRNPWRFSFDKKTGTLFAADVGQNLYEEVDIIEKGGNYGWRIMEGFHCFNPKENCKTEGLKLPIFEYDHNTGISIIGGYVYRGKALPQIDGRYIFADWIGKLFYLEKRGGAWKNGLISIKNKPEGDFRILSFAEDSSGELYILTNQETGPRGTKGAVYKLIKP
ncbi:MAG TPA: PQQ-dependent sugar dehydrogenase [Daejeonella sp.]|nr:PQQ-dependent sugar dehydrogenase [Daejeonella sp.]